MFTSVISSLTSLLPKYFIFGSYVPVLIFGFVNAGLLYLHSAWMRGALHAVLAASTPLTVGVAFVASVVFAYIVSSVQDFMRAALEGRAAWPPRLAQEMRAVQLERRATLDRDYVAARVRRYRVWSARTIWRETLLAAANDGAAHHAGAAGYPGGAVEAAARLEALHRGGTGAAPVEYEDVQQAVDAMAAALRSFDKTADTQLAAAHRELLITIDAIVDRAKETEYALATALQSYPEMRAIQPTRLGNIIAALDGYAVERYGMDLTIFLSRLQAVLVKSDDKAYGMVLDAKTQLDFLVAGAWLSGLTVAGWDVALGVMGGSLVSFLAVAVLGPLVPGAFFALATQNALSYAEAVRACVDLNRFALLRALAIPLPDSLRAERQLWTALSRSTLVGPEGTELSYEHAAP